MRTSPASGKVLRAQLGLAALLFVAAALLKHGETLFALIALVPAVPLARVWNREASSKPTPLTVAPRNETDSHHQGTPVLDMNRQCVRGLIVVPFVATVVWFLLASLFNAALVEPAYGAPVAMVAGTYARYLAFAQQPRAWAWLLAAVSGVVTLALVVGVAIAL